MGQEIADSRFNKSDFQEFSERLKRETDLLGRWFDEGVFSESGLTAGFAAGEMFIMPKLLGTHDLMQLVLPPKNG